MRRSSSSKRPTLATNSPNSVLGAPSSMASSDVPSILDKASRGIAKQQCRTSIRANWRFRDGTLPDRKACSSRVTRKRTCGRAKPLKLDWPKLNMLWATSPRSALALRQTLRMRNGGTGDQLVRIADTLGMLCGCSILTCGSTKLPESSRTSRRPAARRSQDAENPSVSVEDE